MQNGTVTINGTPETEALAKILKEHHRPEVVDVETPDGRKVKVLVAPKGFDIHGLKGFADAYRTAPERREGTAQLLELESFIAHAKRFADVDSAIFASPDAAAPKLVAVLDYHRATAEGAPRYGKHRAVYPFPLSEEWKAWQAKNGKQLGQKDFAEFLEDRIGDVAAPPADHDLVKHGGSLASPSQLVELSRGLDVHVGAQVKQAVKLSSGEAQIQFITEHKDGDGKPLKVPSAFVIQIPVFRNGALYELGVRLRYRVAPGAGVSWFFEIHRADRVFDDAFKEACLKAGSETSLPVFVGTPET